MCCEAITEFYTLSLVHLETEPGLSRGVIFAELIWEAVFSLNPMRITYRPVGRMVIDEGKIMCWHCLAKGRSCVKSCTYKWKWPQCTHLHIPVSLPFITRCLPNNCVRLPVGMLLSFLFLMSLCNRNLCFTVVLVHTKCFQIRVTSLVCEWHHNNLMMLLKYVLFD